eukprot:s3728_g9.t1
MESFAASRDQLIKDLETKFTDYLRNYHQNVNDEVNSLNQRLSCSADEITEYQAELMVAAKEDEGAIRRIQELERRGAIMESGAMRIYQRGMEIQEEYKDEVHHLRGFLMNTETRLQQTQHDSEYASSVASRLYSDGREMQANFENSIMEYRNQSEVALYSHAHNELMQQRSQLENRELMIEKNALHDALEHSRKQAELYEMSMEQITKESCRKVHEANQAKAESDLRLKNTEHDVMKRVEAIKNAETEVIAKLRMESSINVSTRVRMEQYENMYENERTLTDELKAELEIKDSQLRNPIDRLSQKTTF